MLELLRPELSDEEERVMILDWYEEIHGKNLTQDELDRAWKRARNKAAILKYLSYFKQGAVLALLGFFAYMTHMHWFI